MNHDYTFRLRLAVVKAIPDICNSIYIPNTAHLNVRSDLIFFKSKYVYTLAKTTH